jgi:UDP-2,3-diacylglucosamine pyrophosphatase LpxH
MSRSEALRRIEAIEQALREGCPPIGVPCKSGQRNAVAVGLERAGVRSNSSTQLLERVQESAGRRIDWSLYQGEAPRAPMSPRFDPPPIPADDIPVEQLIDQLAERFERRAENAAAKRWMRFALHDAGPYVLAFVGDPHLDDNGCNWPLLKRDVELMRRPHVHGIMLGDVTNNWSGKLQRLYAHQDVSRDRAWKLAEWFWQAVPWLLLVKGNHDIWSQSHGQGDPLDWMARGSAALEDWQARIEVAAGQHTLRVWASHDFKGSSLYNPLHGPMRAQRFSPGDADILAAGHQHHWEIFSGEDADKTTRPHWLVRARGYKYLDPHADRHQYASQQHGATIAAVIDPSRDGPAAVQCYADLAEAVEILEFKRQRWEAACRDVDPKTTTGARRRATSAK